MLDSIEGEGVMTDLVRSYLSQLRADEWRARTGFSEEVEEANRVLFDPRLAGKEGEAVLGAWLQKWQPCLFGRIAAKLGSLSYCLLSEADLDESDEAIQEKIQTARRGWTREAFEGKKSGFIVLAVSPAIASATPGPEVQELARRLCFLYLQTDIEVDKIHLEDVFLEKPGARRTTWRWHAGVNYFCAQGDGRWWNDHRIPGGLAFSVNSVGHLVKSGIIAKAMAELDDATDAGTDDYPESKIDSLDKALELAMRTIAMASNTVSGQATQLLPLPSDRSEMPVAECPVKLSRLVADRNFCQYLGYYHTDVTLPAAYFLPDVHRPAAAGKYLLDFTYLFHKDTENPAHVLMGEGQKIRSAKVLSGGVSALPDTESDQARQLKGYEDEVLVTDYERLRKALEGM